MNDDNLDPIKDSLLDEEEVVMPKIPVDSEDEEIDEIGKIDEDEEEEEEVFMQ